VRFTQLRDILTFSEIADSLKAVYGTELSDETICQVLKILADDYKLIDVINTLEFCRTKQEVRNDNS
jgi:hypothetical protein